MDPPEGLDWVRTTPAGRTWLGTLPTWLAECTERWSLRLGPPFRYAYASLALPADLPDGTAAVLKLQYPDEDSRHEADALAQWNGDGAIRLLAHDPERRALLVERCQPGTPLHELPMDRALDAVTALLPRLWRPAGTPFTPLAEEAAGWIDRMPDNWERAGRPYERRMLDTALDLLTGLASSQGEQVLVNQDLHAGNVLAADREPWLAIDPKPLTGEREFSVVVRWCAVGSWVTRQRPSGTGWTGSPPSWGWTASGPGVGRSDTRWPGASTVRSSFRTRSKVVRWLLDAG